MYSFMQLSDSSNSGVKSEALVKELQQKIHVLQKESEASMQQCNDFRDKIKVTREPAQLLQYVQVSVTYTPLYVCMYYVQQATWQIHASSEQTTHKWAN